MRWHLVCALLVLPATAQAIEFSDLTVTNEGKRYTVHAEGYMDAPAEAVLAVITDYPNLPLLSDTILESEPLGDDGAGGQLVRTRIEFCVMVFCSRAEQVQTVTMPTADQVVSVAIAERSDIDDLMQRWTVVADGGGSRLTYEMVVVNEDFIPPLIGPPLVRGKLRKISRDTAHNIERLAQQRLVADAG